ncbi:MAG TPA: IclR family transcriptional regulator [Mycobacteriales bacterium]|nr:IclR family transcriptional regulator [Mycobacteriales bacterium]
MDVETVTQNGGGVQAVDRALDLLEALASAGSPLGVSALSHTTGLPVGTIHRLLRTLASRGFVRQEASREYALGPALFRVGHASTRAIAAPARPYLARLVEISGETANLAVLEGDHVVYVAQVPSAHRLRMFAEVGRHVLPHSTAVGKVLLADRPAEAAAGVVQRTGLPAHTPNTITDPALFAAELDRVRARGWAVDDEEEETGVRCFAVPVRDGGRVIAAMSVSGPAARFDGVEIRPLVTAMQEVSDTFAAEALRGAARPHG